MANKIMSVLIPSFDVEAPMPLLQLVPLKEPILLHMALSDISVSRTLWIVQVSELCMT